MTLDEKISNYIKLQKEQEELKTKAEELKVPIIEEMENRINRS